MTYRTLLSVSCFHSYYKSGKFRDFDFEIDPLTKKTFQSYGIIHRQHESGFSLLYKKDEAPSPLEKLRDKIQFNVYLKARNFTFLNFSEIPNDLNGNGFWMTNAGQKPNDADVLHKGEFLGNQDYVKFISTLGALRELVGGSKSVQLKNSFQEIIYEGGEKDFDEGEVAEKLDGPGYLSLTADGTTRNFYYQPSGLKNGFGVINLVIDPAGKAGPAFETMLGKEYKIAIETKPVTWGYNVINRDTSSYSDFKVFAGKDVVPTTTATEKLMINGEKAYYIETVSPRQLLEKYEGGLELEMVKSEADRNTRKRMSLPFPDVNRIKVQRVADELRPYTEMYIYF